MYKYKKRTGNRRYFNIFLYYCITNSILNWKMILIRNNNMYNIYKK